MPNFDKYRENIPNVDKLLFLKESGTLESDIEPIECKQMIMADDVSFMWGLKGEPLEEISYQK